MFVRQLVFILRSNGLQSEPQSTVEDKSIICADQENAPSQLIDAYQKQAAHIKE
jgi:hypothetical protein